MKKDNKTIIIGRKSIIENIFKNKKRVFQWNELTLNDVKKYNVIAYTFGNWMKNDEKKQIRWDLLNKITELYNLKIRICLRILN